MFFKIAPDSVIGNTCATGSYPRTRWIPVVMLVWTFWIFATPVFASQQNWLWPTLASFAVFLVLYFRAYYGPRRQILWYSLGIAALGFLLTPANVGGESYLIYACAFLAFTGPRLSVALQRMLLLNLLYALECHLLGLPWVFVGSSILIGMAVGVMNIFFRRNQQQDAQLRLSHDEVRRLAATAERERIGRDLHDLLGHTLSLVALKSELAGRLFDRDPFAARREIAEVERVAREALGQVRHAVTGIRAAAIATELVSARLLLESAGVEFVYHDCDCQPSAEIETVLALALREAATNIQRHARASRAEIRIEAREGQARLSVRDNGRGGIAAQGNGLGGMRERIEALGGTLTIESPRGRGTELAIVLPLPAQAAAPMTPTRIDAPALPVGNTLRHA